MSYRLVELTQNDLSTLVTFASDIYHNAEDKSKYPDFRLTADLDDEGKWKKFFSAFVLPSEFNNNNIRQAYAIVNEENELQGAIGVRRFENWPSWAVSWLLSPQTGVRFIPMFREVMKLMCELHEARGFNEFFVSYPSSREAAYSKIMLPFREKYYSFVECNVPAGTRSPYGFIHALLGQTLHKHDMNLRRYILRRENTEPTSRGGKASKLLKE